MRCLLIATNKVRTPYPVYPLALACLAGALTEAGHEVRQFDCLAAGEDDRQNLAALLDSFAPELIGLSIRNLDLEDSTRPESFVDQATRVMGWVRENSSSPVVLGGAGFSLMPERFMELLQAEYGVVGEGEQSLVSLAGQLEQGKIPASYLFQAPMGSYPRHTVSYDRRISAYYLQWGGMLNLQTKRGCPYNCIYCGYPLIEGHTVRSREPKEIAEEVQRLEREYQARYIFFTDSVFNDPGGKYLEVCEALIRSGSSLPWMAYFRPSGVGREEMKIMKRSGLDAMEVGTDAGCDATLDSLNKGFTIDEAIRFNSLAAECAIPCAHFIMFGAPGETRETVRESLDNLERLNPAVLMAFNGIRILPRTGIHERAVAEGAIAREQDLLEPVYYFSSRVESEDVDRMVREKWLNRPDRVCPGAEGAERVAAFHRRGYTGPIWDRLLRLGNR